MSKTRVETLIPKAIEVLGETFDGAIPSVYQGYITSFGVGIVQVGLKPTLAFYSKESENSNAEGNRKIINDMVAKVLGIDTKFLLKYVLDHSNEEAELTERIKDASVALKLSMRLFDLDKKKGGAS